MTDPRAGGAPKVRRERARGLAAAPDRRSAKFAPTPSPKPISQFVIRQKSERLGPGEQPVHPRPSHPLR